MISVFQKAARDGKPQSMSLLQNSARVTFAVVLLIKANIMSKLRVYVGGDSSRTGIQKGESLLTFS